MRFRKADRRWLKFTKWNSAGYTVDLEAGEPLFLPATPSVYLERLRLQNEFFGDDWQFLGIQADGHNLRLVTSQPDIVGEAPSSAELDHHLREHFGFRRLAIPPMGYHKSLSYLLGSLGLFDVHPANAILTPGGTLVPIDFILVQFDRTDQGLLETRTRPEQVCFWSGIQSSSGRFRQHGFSLRIDQSNSTRPLSALVFARRFFARIMRSFWPRDFWRFWRRANSRAACA